METLTALVYMVQAGDDEAFEKIVEMFTPLLMKVSWQNGHFDDDCYQTCLIALYKGLLKFEFRNML